MVDGKINESQLPPALSALVRKELEPGETMAWLGQPSPGRFARRATVNVIAGILCLGFGLLVVVATKKFHMPHFRHPADFMQLLMPLTSLVFVLAGLGLVLSPWWMRRKALRTAYAITDRRALIVEAGGRAAKVRSYPPEKLGNLVCKQNADGSGDLVLEREITFDGEMHSTIEHGFLAVGNVRDLEAMLGTLAGR